MAEESKPTHVKVCGPLDKAPGTVRAYITLIPMIGWFLLQAVAILKTGGLIMLPDFMNELIVGLGAYYIVKRDGAGMLTKVSRIGASKAPGPTNWDISYEIEQLKDRVGKLDKSQVNPPGK